MCFKFSANRFGYMFRPIWGLSDMHYFICACQHALNSMHIGYIYLQIFHTIYIAVLVKSYKTWSVYCRICPRQFRYFNRNIQALPFKQNNSNKILYFSLRNL